MLEDQEDSIDAVAARLAAVRKALGFTKREFAQRAGLSEQTYGPFENGRRNVSLDAAKKIKAHGLSLAFMYFGKLDDLPHRIAVKL